MRTLKHTERAVKGGVKEVGGWWVWSERSEQWVEGIERAGQAIVGLMR